jgi:hypothetical protein
MELGEIIKEKKSIERIIFSLLSVKNKSKLGQI